MSTVNGTIRKACLLLAFLAGSLSFANPAIAESLPAAPQYHVTDESGTLSPTTLQALRALLYEHEKMTTEQVVIAVFKSLQGQDLVDWTNRIFANWKIGKHGKDNGVLLALYWEDRQARIEVGYGLEPLLTDAKSKLVLYDFLIPELKAGKPDRGVSLATLEILRILESPLIQSGRAQEILRAGGFQGNWEPTSDRGVVRSWFVWVILGFVLVFIALNALTSAEAHYTGSGWSHPSPFPRRRRGGWHQSGWGGWGGGGRSGGGFGGFGGFGGGGGSSGGGGASGRW